MSVAASLRSSRGFFALISVVLVVASLYFARAVLIPIVLAVLITFLLSPFVLALQRRGLGRLSSSLIALVSALTLFACLVFLVGQQLSALLTDLPNHKKVIITKIENLRASTENSWFNELSSTIDEISKRLQDTDPAEDDQYVQPVRIVPSRQSFLQHITLTPIADGLVATALVLVLTFFMLLRREDLRNRLIRLLGHRNLITATKALDDAGSRIGSFLMAQLAVNASFGVVFGLCLALLGVPYPVLGGILGGIMRYVPFLGVWIAAAGPITLSIADPTAGLGSVLMVLGMVLVLEVLYANVVEPFVFGKSIGVSEVMLLISLVFWGWLWGLVGMILATPMTACLAVLGRFVPRLRFLNVLLGDEPALQPHYAFYQRLLAKDKQEAEELVSEFAADHPGQAVYEQLLLPALVLAKTHRSRDEFTDEDEKSVYEQLRATLPSMPAVPDLGMEESNGKTAEKELPLVLGCPVGDEANAVALELFVRVMPRGLVRFEIASPTLMASELIIKIREDDPAIILVASLPPDSYASVRYLIKRLRAEFPEKKFLVACWGLRRNVRRVRERLLEAGADLVGVSLAETRAQLRSLLPAVQQAMRVPEGRGVRQVLDNRAEGIKV